MTGAWWLRYALLFAILGTIRKQRKCIGRFFLAILIGFGEKVVQYTKVLNCNF